MANPVSGSCLCGAVHVEAHTEPQVVGDCYCVDCRKSSGTTHCTHLVFPSDAVAVTGAIAYYESPADSGNVISRGFCPTCGSPVLSLNAGMPGMTFVRASIADDQEPLQASVTVYASRAPSWAPIDRTKPVFAAMPEGGPESVTSRA